MEEKIQEYIDILIGLEPVFKKAGETALLMRKDSPAFKKQDTGVLGTDIVTKADLAVQEEILSKMAKTRLVECQLFAEEDTESVKKFLPAGRQARANGLTLSLDPIDGTIIYASTGRFFLTIVTLADGKDLLYTFCNYPYFNWSRRIANGKVEDFGKMPGEVKTKENLNFSKTIFYTVRPPANLDPDVYKKVLEQGYSFRKVFDVTDEAGSATMFFLGKSGGYFIDGPNPYDGVCAYHYAKTKNLKMHSTLDLSKITYNDHGPHYSGLYLILNE